MTTERTPSRIGYGVALAFILFAFVLRWFVGLADDKDEAMARINADRVRGACLADIDACRSSVSLQPNEAP